MSAARWGRAIGVVAALAAAACGGARRPASVGAVPPAVRDTGAAAAPAPPLPQSDSLAAAVARAAQDSAADQKTLDSLHRKPVKRDSAVSPVAPAAAVPVKGEEVEREAVRLFGEEGRAAVGAAPPPPPSRRSTSTSPISPPTAGCSSTSSSFRWTRATASPSGSPAWGATRG